MSQTQLERIVGDDPANPESQLLPKPVLDIGANQATILTYKIEHEQWERQQAQWANFRNGVNSSLNEATINALQSQDRGMRGIAPATIYAYLTLTYGTVTPADLLRYHKELELPLTDDYGLDSYLSQQMLTHSLLAANGEALTISRKVHHVIQGITASRRFTGVVEHFKLTYPTTAAQTFDALTTLLRQHDANSDKTRTSGGTGHANEATETDVSPDAANAVTDLAAENAKLRTQVADLRKQVAELQKNAGGAIAGGKKCSKCHTNFKSRNEAHTECKDCWTPPKDGGRKDGGKRGGGK